MNNSNQKTAYQRWLSAKGFKPKPFVSEAELIHKRIGGYRKYREVNGFRDYLLEDKLLMLMKTADPGFIDREVRSPFILKRLVAYDIAVARKKHMKDFVMEAIKEQYKEKQRRDEFVIEDNFENFDWYMLNYQDQLNAENDRLERLRNPYVIPQELKDHYKFQKTRKFVIRDK